MLQYFAGLVWLVATSCPGADQSYYQSYLALVGTNDECQIGYVCSPLLLDTNNTTPKLTNEVINLHDSNVQGCLGKICLGMTMDEVVAAWGKPQRFYSRCLGGRRLDYWDAIVIFDPGSNSVLKIISKRNENRRFEKGLSASSPMADFIQILGTPTRRSDDPPYCNLMYDMPAGTLNLHFYVNLLSSFRLERRSDKPVPKQ